MKVRNMGYPYWQLLQLEKKWPEMQDILPYPVELGAHVVKTYYCKNFEKVVEGCPVPVIIAGGKKLPEKDALDLTFNAIKDGASGVDMGRNIWQSDHPIEMIQAVRSIVHDGLSVQESLESFFLKKNLQSNELETLNTR